MTSRTLLEKLYEPQSLSSQGSPDAEQELWRSIQYNLSNILNSGKGHSFSAPDFGMDDLTTQLRQQFSAKAVMEMLQRTIEKYEPRLSHVKVTVAPSDDPCKLAFKIQAEMVSEEGEFSSTFHTTLQGNGSMKVD